MNNQGADERQLVVFDLAGESYGVDINAVREIIRIQQVTHVPDAPDYVEGVMNLRGNVIPVIDLRKRLGLKVGEANAESRVVVVDIAGQGIGVIVDAVREVLRIANSAVEPASAVITTEDSFYLQGIAKLENRLLILLDIERALSEQADELRSIRGPEALAA
jgi:purine-binding chemotaxis protein CheW